MTRLATALLCLGLLPASAAAGAGADGVHTLRGRVQASGRSRAPVLVALVDADDVPIRAPVRVGGDGTFEIPGLATGGYTVRAQRGAALERVDVFVHRDEYVALDLEERNARTPRMRRRAGGGVELLATTLESFDDGSISDYAWLGGILGGPAPSAAHDGPFGLVIEDGIPPGWIFRNVNAIAVGNVVTAWVRPRSAGRAYVGFGASSTGTFALAVGMNTGSFLVQHVQYGSPHEVLAEVPMSWTSGRWYRLEARWTSPTTVTGRVYDSDGVTLLAEASGASTAPQVGGGFAWRGFGGLHDYDTLVNQSTGVAGVPALPAWALIACVLGALAVGRALLPRDAS